VALTDYPPTAFTHPYDKQYGSIPILTIGKYFQREAQVWMPLAVQVHHGLVDGIHVGMLFKQVREIANRTDWLPQ
jgi:chloramphenicol O-acetyltransferase type A